MLCHLREYALYTGLRKLHHSGGFGQLMGKVCKRTCALTTDQHCPSGRQTV